MYQWDHRGTQSSNADLLWPAPGPAAQTNKRLKVLILGSGGRHDHFAQILAANVQQWGFEACLLSVAMVLGGEQGNVEVEGDVLVYDLDDPLHMSTVSPGKTSDGEPFSAPFLTNSEKGWPRVRLMIALSSRSVSRFTLEQIGAVALLYKPFEIERLQRYLRVFQRVLLDESAPEVSSSDGLSQLSAPSVFVSEEARKSSRRSARILVVEDHPHVADAIRQCLEIEPGYDIRVAEDGLNALEQCVDWRPHCIVTDLLLPYMNGYQVMRALSAAAACHMPAFVVISALTQHELPERHVYPQRENVIFIDKPFQIENLLDAVDRALA